MHRESTAGRTVTTTAAGTMAPTATKVHHSVARCGISSIRLHLKVIRLWSKNWQPLNEEEERGGGAGAGRGEEEEEQEPLKLAQN